ncbi:serine/threonine protein kinase [Brasilonema bromeliae]|uniref:Serine/threonine protein kinase n=1 Tax=Brasilonema bromeliae SPC951 TaxID=385972 RepID=A0ABX1P6Z4_9CYAN|nr:serine/threonine-protein kinase [Brasilonema bromeliae]NMG19385.1 serine/threonine protein kinase [Brasilonema bromeliae SPC951]
MNGQVLGDRYEIQQQLGKKAGRRTLLARDLVTGEMVVVKLLSFSSDFEWEDLKLFEREAETLKKIAHPSIPRYLDYFEINSSNIKGFALVQTYIPAQTLDEYIKAGRTFTEAEVKQIAKALLTILIYLHEHKPPTIHRDIKPSNILLTNRSGNSVGQIYLVDFGSVQTVAASEGGTMTVVGTYGYMPPEQFGGRTVPASDLYSLGATLIYLVTGTQPADLPQKDLRIQFEQAAILSPILTEWLRRMSEPSLERRLSSAREALAALEHPLLLQQQHPEQMHLTDKKRGIWYWDGQHWTSKDQEISQKLNTKSESGRHSLTIKMTKPAGSKITLKKDENSFDLLIPPTGFQPSMTFMVLFAISWNSFILFWTISALAAPFPINIPFALFSLPFWGAGFQMLSWIFFPLCRRTRLRLNRQKIAFIWDFFGLKFNRVASSPTQDITKLVYSPKTFKTDSQGNRVEILPQLIIWAGVHKYQLGGTHGVIKSEPEIEWLAHELSDWLGLPLTQE